MPYLFYVADFLILNETMTEATASNVVNRIQQLWLFHEYFGIDDMIMFDWIQNACGCLFLI